MESKLVDGRNASPVLYVWWWPEQCWSSNAYPDCALGFNGLQGVVSFIKHSSENIPKELNVSWRQSL